MNTALEMVNAIRGVNDMPLFFGILWIESGRNLCRSILRQWLKKRLALLQI